MTLARFVAKRHIPIRLRATLLMIHMGMWPYKSQAAFFDRYCQEVYDQPELVWEEVLRDVDCVRGSTTALAIILAVNPAPKLDLSWVKDHHPGHESAKLLIRRARQYRRVAEDLGLW